MMGVTDALRGGGVVPDMRHESDLTPSSKPPAKAAAAGETEALQALATRLGIQI